MTKSKNDRLIFFVAALCLVLFYVPTLWHGYYRDDLKFVNITFRQWWQDPFEHHGRPIWYLTYPIANLISTSSFWHHAVNLMLFATFCTLCAWFIRSMGLPAIAYPLCLAALCHPSMVWPVSWIGQRNDLVLLNFLILAVALFRHRIGVTWIILSSLSKSPFVVQNLVFAFLYLRDRRFISALLSILSFLVPVYYVWHTYYQPNAEAAAHGLYLLKGDGIGDLFTELFFRGVKVLEGLLLTFIPFSAYAVSIPVVLGISLMLLLLWGTLAYLSARNWRALNAVDRQRVWFYLTLALSLSLPYGFGSGLRIYVPATLFYFLAASLVIPDTFHTRLLVLVIAATLFFGSILNYGATMTARHYFEKPIVFPLQPAPADTWNLMRREWSDKFVVDYLSGETEGHPADQ